MIMSSELVFRSTFNKLAELLEEELLFCRHQVLNVYKLHMLKDSPYDNRLI